MAKIKFIRTKSGSSIDLLSRLRRNSKQHVDFPITLDKLSVYNPQTKTNDNLYTISAIAHPDYDKITEIPRERLYEGIKQAYQIGTMHVDNEKAIKSITQSLHVFVYSQLGMNLGSLQEFKEYWKYSFRQANTKTFIVQYNTHSDTVEFAEISLQEYNQLVNKLVKDVSKAREEFDASRKFACIKDAIENMDNDERAKLLDLLKHS